MQTSIDKCGLIPQRGCKLAEVNMGNAKVIVEYEYMRAEPATETDPAEPAAVIVYGVLINGALIDAEDYIAAHQIEAWEAELMAVEVGE